MYFPNINLFPSSTNFPLSSTFHQQLWKSDERTSSHHVEYFVSSSPSITFEPRYGWWHAWVTIIILGILILSVIIGNAFVVAAIVLERNLQNVSNYLVLSLAVADLLVGCLVMPLSAIYEVSSKWWLGKTLCDIFICLDVFCCTASILHLVIIALDRYWAVTNVNYIRHRSAIRIGILIICVWLLSIIISIPSRFYQRNQINATVLISLNDGLCVVDDSYSYTIFSTVGSFYIPMLILCIIYMRIYLVARQRIRKKPFHQPRSTKIHINESSSHHHTNHFFTKNQVADVSVIKTCKTKCTEVNTKKKTHIAGRKTRPSSKKAISESRYLQMVSSHPNSTSNILIATANQHSTSSYITKVSSTTATAVSYHHGELETQPLHPFVSSVITVNIWADAHIPFADQDIMNGSTILDFKTGHVEEETFTMLNEEIPRNETNPGDWQFSTEDAEKSHLSYNDDNTTLTSHQGSAKFGEISHFSKTTTKTSNSDEEFSLVLGSGAPETQNSRHMRLCMEKEKLGHRRERKAARTLAIITGCFLLCWIPFFILTLLRPFCSTCVISPILDSGVLWLGYVNSLLNPIIYTIFSPDFRNAFSKILFGRYRRRR